MYRSHLLPWLLIPLFTASMIFILADDASAQTYYRGSYYGPSYYGPSTSYYGGYPYRGYPYDGWNRYPGYWYRTSPGIGRARYGYPFVGDGYFLPRPFGGYLGLGGR